MSRRGSDQSRTGSEGLSTSLLGFKGQLACEFYWREEWEVAEEEFVQREVRMMN